MIAGAAGAACIAFPPSRHIAIPIGIGAGIGALIDGTDAYSDFHNYSNTLGLDLRDCCRDLQVRSDATP